MHLIINTTGKKIQPFCIDNLICSFVNLFIYLLNKTILDKNVGNKLLIFINYGGGFYEDR